MKRAEVISYGIIMYRCPSDWVSVGRGSTTSLSPEYLLIRRRDTLGYMEFIRGKYGLVNRSYIQTLINLMTTYEKERLIRDSFDDLWHNAWLHQNQSMYIGEYIQSRDKFEALKLSGDLASFIEKSDTRWTHPEWGFPKGRKKHREYDLACAMREFEEETGIRRENYEIIRNIKPLEESFVGSNGVNYRHKYFVAVLVGEPDIRLDETNIEQCKEVGAMEWMTAENAIAVFRPWHGDKIRIMGVLDRYIKRCVLADVDAPAASASEIHK